MYNGDSFLYFGRYVVVIGNARDDEAIFHPEYDFIPYR